MARIAIFRKGESVPFEFDRDGESIDGWVCLIEVKKLTADTASVSRTITPTGDAWTGLLSSAETSALAIGLYRLIGVLTNSSTGEEEQIPTRFSITESWAT